MERSSAGRRVAVGGYHGAQRHPPTGKEALPTNPSHDKFRGGAAPIKNNTRSRIRTGVPG